MPLCLGSRRWLPNSFRLILDGTDYQLLIRFDGNIRPHCLPENFFAPGKFEVVVFRLWTEFKINTSYGPADYPKISPQAINEIVLRAWRDNGYLDSNGHLAKKKCYGALPRGSTVVDPKVATKMFLRYLRDKKVA